MTQDLSRRDLGCRFDGDHPPAGLLRGVEGHISFTFQVARRRGELAGFGDEAVTRELTQVPLQPPAALPGVGTCQRGRWLTVEEEQNRLYRREFGREVGDELADLLVGAANGQQRGHERDQRIGYYDVDVPGSH